MYIRIASLLLMVGIVAGLVSGGVLTGADAQSPGSTTPLIARSQAQTGPVVPPPLRPRTFAGAPQLKPMFLEKSLIAPEKWWKYEEDDDDRPARFSVEQTGTVSLGGSSLIDHGAQLQYRVRQYPTAAIAHNALQKMVSDSRRPHNLKRTVTPLRDGDEAVEVTAKLVPDGRTVVEFSKDTLARYGNYVVQVYSRSDLRALGPRPKIGERRWMSEPVHDRVVAAVFARWSHYKTLLASR